MTKKKNLKTNKSNLSNITQKWVDILISFAGNYSGKYSASELSRKSGVPQQTVSRSLNQIAGNNMISYKLEGKNKLFYLDLEKNISGIMLNILEFHKSLGFHLHTKAVSVIINDLLRHCESLLVFGSYSSGNFDEDSDLDVLFLGRCSKPEIDRIRQKQVIEINGHYSSYSGFSKALKSKNALAMEIIKNHVIFGDVYAVVGMFLRDYYGQR